MKVEPSVGHSQITLKASFLTGRSGDLTPSMMIERVRTPLWQNGRQATLVEIVGSNNETERITEDNVEPYLEMVSAPAKDGITISIRSVFRSFPEQVVLFSLFNSNPKKFALRGRNSQTAQMK